MYTIIRYYLRLGYMYMYARKGYGEMKCAESNQSIVILYV